MRLARVCLLWISLSVVVAQRMSAQSLLPQVVGGKTRYNAVIELPKGYLSGVCVLLNDGDVLKGSFFNEFAISYLDLSFSSAEDKVKLHSVQAMMDKWYIRKVLRHDLRMLLHRMEEGVGEYQNEKRKMTYRFTPLPEDESENTEEDESEE